MVAYFKKLFRTVYRFKQIDDNFYVSIDIVGTEITFDVCLIDKIQIIFNTNSSQLKLNKIKELMNIMETNF